jgi:glycosyltransferase involved in cell wall biosynthesis
MQLASDQKNFNTKFNHSVSLLCWAYNEEDSIEEFLEKATKMMEEAVDDYEIVLIEDGSTDNTYEIAKSLQTKNNRLKIYKNEKNLNVGFSSRRAIEKATKKYCFWQTVDWGYDLGNLRQYLEYLKDYDIVQGVRRNPVKVRTGILKPFVALLKLFGLKHLTKRSDTIYKAIISLINYIIIRTLFRVPLSDFQNVTFYQTKWLQSINFEAIGSFANPEGLIKSYWSGMSIKEVPISFIPREKGDATGTSFNSIIRSVYDIIRLWFTWIVFGKRKFIKKGKIYRLAPTE